MPLEPVVHLTEVRSWPGNIPIESTYTVGIAGERFFRALKDEAKILATRCESCGITYAPARLYCERCLANLSDNWTEVGPEGTVQSVTVVHINPDGSRRPEPDVVAAIQLDGANTVLIHRLTPADAENVRIGARVTPVFRPAELREGSILDIDHFRLV
ncbi:MAG: Zn-ribbon domain-containing OB-fold protein [Chloroflexi bacterium]|nr:MAG: Zn-ribbon domain-containing OB-fold protein [Chloroflexota bacterium]